MASNQFLKTIRGAERATGRAGGGAQTAARRWLAGWMTRSLRRSSSRHLVLKVGGTMLKRARIALVAAVLVVGCSMSPSGPPQQ